MRRVTTLLLVLAACSEPPRRSSCDDKAICVDPDALGERPMCDPILQLGCMAGEKCTWITRGSYIGCARDGTAQLGATCAYTLTEGIDGCARGLVCGDTIMTSTCLLICDLNGQLPPACPTGTACLATGLAFTRDGDHAAGLCR